MRITAFVRKITDFGAELGAGDRMTLKTSEPLFAEFKGLNEADQEAAKATFVKAYFVGRTGLKEAQAELILAMGRPEREALDAEYENAKRSGEMKWTYHFVTRGLKAGNAGDRAQRANFNTVLKSLPKGITKRVDALAEDYFEGDYDKLLEAIRALAAAHKAAAK